MRKEAPNERRNNKYIGNITISKTPLSLLLRTRESHDSIVFGIRNLYSEGSEVI